MHVIPRRAQLKQEGSLSSHYDESVVRYQQSPPREGGMEDFMKGIHDIAAMTYLDLSPFALATSAA